MLTKGERRKGADKTVAGEGKGEYRRKEEKGSTLMICEKPIRGAYYFIGLLKNTDIHTLLTYACI